MIKCYPLSRFDEIQTIIVRENIDIVLEKKEFFCLVSGGDDEKTKDFFAYLDCKSYDEQRKHFMKNVSVLKKHGFYPLFGFNYMCEQCFVFLNYDIANQVWTKFYDIDAYFYGLDEIEGIDLSNRYIFFF